MRRRWKAGIAAATVAIAVAAINVAVVRAGASDEPAWATAGAADCAVVLGARVYADGTPSPVLRDRLDTALDLYRAGKVRRILVSGDHASDAYDEPNAMRRYLEAHAVPAGDVFTDHAGFDTYSTMWRARHVFDVKRAIVVTQDFHLARSVYLARAMGIEADGASADRRLYRGIVWLHAREVVSRTKAAVDVAAGRQPHFGGPRIPIGGPASASAG